MKKLASDRRQFHGIVHHTGTWDQLPDAAIVTPWAIAEYAGVNIRTVQRHALLNKLTGFTKRDVDRWMQRNRGEFKVGRPRKPRQLKL